MPRTSKAVKLSPPPTIAGANPSFQIWMNSFYARVGDGPLLVQGYSRTAMPPANEWGSITSPNYFSSMIFVVDAGGATPMMAFSNGTNWLRVDNGAAV